MSGDNSPWVSFIYRPPMSWMGFPCGSAGKESACNAGDLGLIPGLGRCPGEGKGYPLQYSGPGEFPGLYGVTKSQTRLSGFHFHVLFLAVLGLHCSVRAFSSCGEHRALSSCGGHRALSSCGEHRALSSCGGHRALSSCSGHRALSGCGRHRALSSCGERAAHCSGSSCCTGSRCACSVVSVHWLSCPTACGTFLG